MREAKKSIIIALRAWLAYAFADEQAGRAHLQKAHHAAITEMRRNPIHLKIKTLAIFIAIEAGHFDTANELLDKAMGYRSFLRSHEPKHYSELCYLYALLEIRQNRTRSARKHWRNLLDSASTHSLDMRVMIGRLHLAMGEYEDAYAQLTGAFAGGCRSPYVFEGLYRYYQTARTQHTGPELLSVLYYAAVRGADIIDISADGSAALSAAVEADPQSGEKLYRASQYHPLLKDICARRIRENDKSAEAYALYLSAINRQVHVPGLYAHLVQTAYKNDVERINRYTLNQFLQTAEIDTELAVYAYHLILTDPAQADLLTEHSNKILQLAVRCLSQGITGRRANSLYYYYWKRCRAIGITGAQIDLAESIIQADLTCFVLEAERNTAARFVYVTDSARRGMEVYELPESRAVTIEAAGLQIAYTCMGAGRRSVLHEHLTVHPMVGGAEPDTYQYFFEKGDRRFYLLRHLADNYMQDPTPAAIPVLEALLAQKNLVKPYRMRLLLTLGRIYFDGQQYEKALESYRAVDENTPDLPRQLLQIYLRTDNFTQAAALVDRKYIQIPADFLIKAFIELLPHEECHPPLANAAYWLLMNHKITDGTPEGDAAETLLYDALLDLALTHFPFSQSELLALSAARAAPDPRIDKRVLEGSLWMSAPDPPAQAAFVRAQRDPDCAHLLAPFVTLCAYHMLTTHFCPEYETLNALEKHYFASDPTDNILGLALGQTCLRHNLTTLRSERIIADALANQEENGLLLPVFKEHKPAQLPFIEKHQPFLYKSLPGKEVYLYYRLTPDTPFTAKPMEYLRFGLYLTCVPMFYNEEITYYYSEELPTGSITTRENTHKNTTPYLLENTNTEGIISDPAGDPFFVINNAIILEQMFKHDQVEAIIAELVKEVVPVRSGLM